MSEPFVSVLTPTYNHERFIGSCVESVLAQSYRNWEMVIVDDGSTDRTVEVIQRFTDP
ncbi:MAG: glycosyltransferase, partial [Synergistales bacterium]|nr:glycosyltransferase [Synergistales bacterium]